MIYSHPVGRHGRITCLHQSLTGWRQGQSNLVLRRKPVQNMPKGRQQREEREPGICRQGIAGQFTESNARLHLGGGEGLNGGASHLTEKVGFEGSKRDGVIQVFGEAVPGLCGQSGRKGRIH